MGITFNMAGVWRWPKNKWASIIIALGIFVFLITVSIGGCVYMVMKAQSKKIEAEKKSMVEEFKSIIVPISKK